MMRQYRKRFFDCCILVVLMLSGSAWMAQAQQPRPPPTTTPGRTETPVRIRRMPRLGRTLMTRTPDFRVAGSSASRRPREWAHFEVSFDTLPEWIDELTFTYHVMTQRRDNAETPFSLFSLTVRYIDVARGPEHLSSVFLLPSAIQRFGEPVAMALEISLDGEVVARDSVSSISPMPDDWWQNPLVVDRPTVVRREGYLLDRSQTPFSLVNWDDYEVVR